ncbi:MAG: sensor domain-containing diguanylate cyclase, partial [Calditrichaeota bacterium]|nr:sensor domain-containing diguanylate cyclase [Calditrichota bacterium]
KSKFLSQVANLECQLLTPLVHCDHRFGLVIIGNKHNNRPYSLAEIDIFTTLTNFLAVALSNARIYKEMERISLTDPLTGLFNRRYFDNYLDTEIARAKRFEHPLSLVMLDVDHFKNYNDQLGHLNGDHLLVSLAEVLTGTVRRSDIVARYGGEEFCIILPEIARDGALVFSERLRNTISAHPFRKREVQPDGHVSISIGTATYPDDAQASNDLVEKADKAMYQAKNNGRNRVAVFD